MNDQHEDIAPPEGTDRKYRIREDGTLEATDAGSEDVEMNFGDDG